MAISRDIKLVIGNDRDLTFEVFNQNGGTDEELDAAIEAGTATMQDVTGWALEFAVRLKDNSTGAALIDKSSGSPVEISITGTYNSSRSVNTQRVVVHIFDTDTALADGSDWILDPKTYRYSLKRTDEGAETTIAEGDFELVIRTLR